MFGAAAGRVRRRALMAVLVPLALLAGALLATPAMAATGKVSVCATVETDPVQHAGDAADDTAIWLNPTDRSKSTVIGVDKLAGGGLSVYDLSGHELYRYPDDRLNNVDIRYGVPLGGARVTLVGATNRANRRVDFWKVDEADGSLTPVGSMPTSKAITTALGLALYRSPVSGAFYAFVTDSGHTDQYLLDGSSGQMTGTLVRQLVLQNPTEGLVADDDHARLYVSEEGVGGVTRYGAEPGDPVNGTRVDTTTDDPTAPGHIVPSAKGLSIYYGRDGAGYLIVASQGGNSFDVYDRGGSNAWKGEFGIADCSQFGTDRVTATDGQDVTDVNLGPAFPSGLFTAQDTNNTGANQNFKYVPWQSIASALGLLVDTSYDPRTGDTSPPATAITAGPPTSTTATGASISFSSTSADTAGFECSLDGRAFVSCTSPATFTSLTVGSHSFAVRARDGSGNVDPTPASRAWIVIGALPAQSGGRGDGPQATVPLGVTPTTLLGTARPGGVLTCTAGTFEGTPAPTLSTVWLRSGVLIQGATAETYVVVAADAGSSLVCRVTASNGIGSSSATSNLVAVPAASATATAAAISISIASHRLAAHDRLRLGVACPPLGPPTCSGTLTLATAKPVAVRKGGRRRVVVLGRVTFRVRAGKHLSTSVRLSAAGASLVRRLRALPVRLITAGTGAAGIGAAGVHSRTFTLHRRA